MKPYAALLTLHTTGRKVSQVAEEWGVPRHVLDEGLYGNVNAPSAKYLPSIAHGMGMSVEELLAKLSSPPPEETPRPMVAPQAGGTA